MLNEGNQSNTQFYTVSTFVISFYYGSGTVIKYGSGSGSATLLVAYLSYTGTVYLNFEKLYCTSWSNYEFFCVRNSQRPLITGLGYLEFWTTSEHSGGFFSRGDHCWNFTFWLSNVKRLGSFFMLFTLFLSSPVRFVGQHRLWKTPVCSGPAFVTG